jgi:hypothetical protein
MVASTFHNKLVSDLAVARQITYSVDPLVCRTTIQDLKVQAYILLAHAAVEEYLEALVLSTAHQAVVSYAKSRKICRALIGLVTCGLIGRMEEKALSKKVSEELFQNVEEFANVSYGRFKSLVGDNNGIKIQDQRKLLLPVGVDPQTEDPVTMAALDGFGGKRGAIAHGFKIMKKHTLSEIDSDLATIRAGLLNYDRACAEAVAV